MLRLMKQLQNYDPRFRDYFVALTTLGVASKISIHSLTEDFLEILWTLFEPVTAADERYEAIALLSIRKAIKLARQQNMCNYALEMLFQEISKAYLHHSLVYDHESTHCVVHVLLATLFYKSAQRQAAVDHCKQVLKQNFRTHHGFENIGADYLPQIDDNVDSVFGLVLLYRYVQTHALHPGVYPQEVSNLAFTVELLAHYMYAQCLTAAISKRCQVTKYQQRLSKAQRLNL